MNNRIRALRKAMGLTLDEFGNRIGLKKSTLSLIENKKTMLLNKPSGQFAVNLMSMKTGFGTETEICLIQSQLLN